MAQEKKIAVRCKHCGWTTDDAVNDPGVVSIDRVLAPSMKNLIHGECGGKIEKGPNEITHPVSVKRFPNDGGDFSALCAVEEWLKERGYITGSTQRDSPIGVHRENGARGISKWRNLSPDERQALHGRITWENGGAREGDAILTFAGSDDAAIPVERWGKDHWSTFAFVAVWCETYGTEGFDIRSKCHHMRTDADRHPEFGNAISAAMEQSGREFVPGDDGGHYGPAKKYPTRLKDGEVEDHDDWDCLEDIEAAGMVLKFGTGTQPVVLMTDRGLEVSGQLIAHKTRGGNYGDFEVKL